ncbi:MAG TPA: hypothetical protein VNI54_11785 [Thermoanaerobaculia bacterium]|nr:hypothetical protein [Thermoanaerobaculia bacterium]
MKKTLLILAVVLVASWPVLAKDGPIVATTSLPYSSVLPGVPFDLNVELKNVSAAPAVVGLVARLVITTADGTEIRPRGTQILEPHSLSEPETSIVLAPGETAVRTLSWSRFAMPNWASDSRYSGPGAYTVAVELSSGAEGAAPIRTSGATLVREVAPGVDTDVWERMQQLSGGRWSDDGFVRRPEGRQLIDEILTAHRTSSYYPYALL